MIDDQKLEQNRYQNYRYTLVPTGSEQYKMISTLFHASMPFDIIRIERNNNSMLYQKHLAVTNKAPLNQIKYLFHGSNHENYIKIMSDGFDITLSRNGALGNGIYFADEASYSNDYTNRLTIQTTSNALVANMLVSNMLVCRVYLRDDTRHQSSIHCVQDQNLGFPEYVIYYSYQQIDH
jgi:hypothetical protein